MLPNPGAPSGGWRSGTRAQPAGLSAGSEVGVIRPDSEVLARVRGVMDEGRELWRRFDRDVRRRRWHPFVPADYERSLRTLLALREPGRRFLEWGSAMGVITIMADLLGFEAYGIELDAELVAVARELARRHGSGARFAQGSFLPAGYEFRPSDGDGRLGTIGYGRAAYAELGHGLADFDVVWGYPWTGEEPIMRDLIRRYGRADGCLVLHGPREDEQVRGGTESGA